MANTKDDLQEAKKPTALGYILSVAIGIGAAVGLTLALPKDVKDAYKNIYKTKTEPGYIYDVELREADVNRNNKHEKVLKIKGRDHLLKETQDGYKLVPFAVEETVKDGKTLLEIIEVDNERLIWTYKIADLSKFSIHPNASEMIRADVYETVKSELQQYDMEYITTKLYKVNDEINKCRDVKNLENKYGIDLEIKLIDARVQPFNFK